MTSLAPMTISEPYDLVTAARLRRQELGISCEELDDAAGLTPRHWNKIENWGRPHGRGLGATSFTAIFAALGLRVIVVPDRPHPRVQQLVDEKQRRNRKRAA